jgi:hypothetical protein
MFFDPDSPFRGNNVPLAYEIYKKLIRDFRDMPPLSMKDNEMSTYMDKEVAPQLEKIVDYRSKQVVYYGKALDKVDSSNNVAGKIYIQQLQHNLYVQSTLTYLTGVHIYCHFYSVQELMKS